MWGNRIKELLEERNMKQKKFAQLAGVSPVQVSRWINSIHLTTEVIETVCKALDIEMIQFFFKTEDLAQSLKISSLALEMARQIDKLENEKQKELLKATIENLLKMAN